MYGPLMNAYYGKTSSITISGHSLEWVLHRHKAIGKVLVANYEGFEHAITTLLWDIETSHFARKSVAMNTQ